MRFEGGIVSFDCPYCETHLHLVDEGSGGNFKVTHYPVSGITVTPKWFCSECGMTGAVKNDRIIKHGFFRGASPDDPVVMPNEADIEVASVITVDRREEPGDDGDEEDESEELVTHSEYIPLDSLEDDEEDGGATDDDPDDESSEEYVCGAITSDGGTCQRAVLLQNSRCFQHAEEE